MNAYEVKNLVHQTSDGTMLFNEFNLSLPVNKKTVLLGSHQSGKTLLLNYLSGILLPKAGQIQMKELPLTNYSRKELKQKINLITRTFKIPILTRTVWEFITSSLIKMKFSKNDVIDRASLVLRTVDLFEDRYQDVKFLIPPQIMKLKIAQALLYDSQILLFDDPLSGLDPSGYAEIVALLQMLHLTGKTVIVTTYDVDFASAWSDHVVVMKEFRVVAEGHPSILVNPELMKKANLRLPHFALPFSLITELKPSEYPKSLKEAVQMNATAIMKMEGRK